MKALHVHQFQDYHKHAVEVVEPSPMKAGHVRINIKAAGVNFPDILIAQGKYLSLIHI